MAGSDTTLMKYLESVKKGLIVLSLGSGDLLLESIRKAAEQADIHTGVLMTGLGSLTRAHIHTLGSEMKLEGPLEVLNFNGIIADHEPHIHISLVDGSGMFYGGHLLEGCPVHTVVEIAIMRLPDLKLTRRIRDGSRFELLDMV